MSNRYINAMVVTIGGCIGCTALYGLLKVITPDPEELKKKLPENNPRYMQSSQNKSNALRKALQEAADDPNPLYRK